jgi:hypothetical protein
MIKFNYNEPEFKVVLSKTEDVIATSLTLVDQTWDAGAGNGGASGDGPDLDDLFNV